MKTSYPCILALLCGVALPNAALADGTLHAGSQTLFPDQIAITSEVTAQVEITSITLTFASLEKGGDYVLTVPSPLGASSIGVDLNRGKGFEPLAISAKAPPVGVSGGPNGNAAVAVWEGESPLLATLAGMQAGPLTVRARFMRLLRRHKAAVVFEVKADRCPLRPPSGQDPKVTISIAVNTFRPIQEILSQGIPGKVDQPTPQSALITFGPASLTATMQAEISYREQTNGVQAHFLAHRTPEADPLGSKAGYFLLVIDADDAGAAASPPRTLNLVIDRSGSMQDQKIDQAQRAAMAMLENLRPSDHFNIHAFNDLLSSWRPRPVLASGENIAAATDFVRALDANGSTDLNAGIQAGLGGGNCTTASELNFDAMILLSDGLPTAGVTNTKQIHDDSLRHNCNEARVFTFSVGQDADGPLLEAIARSSRGKNFVLNDAQAETRLGQSVRQLFEDIYSVRLTDIALALEGNATHDVLPDKPGDLFDGGQLFVVGRYDRPGSGIAKITAHANGTNYAHDLPLHAPERADDNAFIKYIWATEKVGTLLAELGRGVNASASVQKITEIGLAYSIQTPYTSFDAVSPSSTTGNGSSGTNITVSPLGSGSGSGYSSDSGSSGAGDVDPLALSLGALLVLTALCTRRRRTQ
jgi:uncharacterized protein YegL